MESIDMVWWHIDRKTGDMMGDSVAEEVTRTFNELLARRERRGVPRPDHEELARIVAALLTEQPGAYTLPEGRVLTGIRAVFGGGDGVIAGLARAEIREDERDALRGLVSRLARHWRDQEGAPRRAPSIAEILSAFDHVFRKWGKDRLRPGEKRRLLGLEPILTDGTTPLQKRSFRHPDGRVWSITTQGASRRIECVLPDDPEPIIKEQSCRTWLECSNEAAALIEEQLRDGFVEI